MSLQLLLIGAAIFALPAIGRLIRELIRLLVGLVAAAFTVLFVVLVLAAFASHGKLI